MKQMDVMKLTIMCVVEAKSIECEDFNIDSYIIHSEVYKQIGDKKQIICLFIYKSKNIIHIYKYKF